MNTLTPAQKAARTRFDNKAWAKHDIAICPAREAYYAFAETLYPERNRIIDEAEAEKDRIIAQAIAEAEAKCQAICDAAMAEFEKTMEPLEVILKQARKEAYDVYSQEMAEFDANQSLAAN